jgi:hypothetical protein
MEVIAKMEAANEMQQAAQSIIIILNIFNRVIARTSLQI